MKFSKEQKRAIKRICEDYDFEDLKELKEYLKDEYGDDFDADWFTGQTEEECYEELRKVVERF